MADVLTERIDSLIERGEDQGCVNLSELSEAILQLSVGLAVQNWNWGGKDYRSRIECRYHPHYRYAGLAEAIDTYAVEDLLSQGDRVEFRLCGIASNLAKRLAKKANRPWVSFTLATKNASLPLNTLRGVPSRMSLEPT